MDLKATRIEPIVNRTDLAYRQNAAGSTNCERLTSMTHAVHRMLLIMLGESWWPRFLDEGSWSSRETMVVQWTRGGYDAKGAGRPQHRGWNSTAGATRCVRTNARSNPGRNRDKDTVRGGD